VLRMRALEGRSESRPVLQRRFYAVSEGPVPQSRGEGSDLTAKKSGRLGDLTLPAPTGEKALTCWL
jgi:hypothetical protein